MNTIEWVKTRWDDNGGLIAWTGQPAYPEATGYIIPTLLNYGEKKFAKQCADWLEEIQNSDGSFDGIDGVKRAFDTAACYEGLKAARRKEAAGRALAWLESQLMHDGQLRIHPDTEQAHVYNLRSLAVMGLKVKTYDLTTAQRYHYLAYAIEGLYRMGFLAEAEMALNGIQHHGRLLPDWLDGRGSDTCATAQIACLRMQLGMNADTYIEAVRAKVDKDGGVLHNNSEIRKTIWTAKFYLDMEWLARS